MLAKEGVPYIAVLLIIVAFFYYIFPVLALIPFTLLLFVLFFFRNPSRKIIKNNRHILSPADGTIVEIKELKNHRFFEGRVVKVSIFLSVLNVHINRSPVSGNITHTEYRPGKYLPAFKSHASEINERNTVIIENEHVKVLVNQITGFIARRIVFYKKRGDFLNQGQRLGMIKFGSRTEIIMPASIKIKVREGQKVKAGITILGVLGDE